MVELGGEIELDALPGPGKGHSSNQQHEEDEVGKGGCEIHHLARGLHPLQDTEEHDDPGQQQAEAEVPANLPRSADALAALYVQDIAAVGNND